MNHYIRSLTKRSLTKLATEAEVHEDSSTGTTRQFASAVEFRKRSIVSTLFCLLIISPLWAKSAQEKNNDWQCTAQDSNTKEWSRNSAYKRVASSKAFEACKKESAVPTSCKAIKTSCAYFGEGTISGEDQEYYSMWHCTALDQRARPWNSNLYSNQDEAALAAKSLCKEHSSIPESCYVNLLTCKTRNRT